MSDYLNSCSKALPPYVCNDCQVYKQGQIIGIGLIDSTNDLTDYTNLAQWQAAQAAGHVIVLPSVIGDRPIGSPTEVSPGYGRQASRVTGVSRQVNFKLNFTCENREFFENLLYQTKYKLFYWTRDNLYVTPSPVSFFADLVIQESPTTNVEWQGNAKWSGFAIERCYEIDTTFFDNCTLGN
jgi:hypothetical protein